MWKLYLITISSFYLDMISDAVFIPFMCNNRLFEGSLYLFSFTIKGLCNVILC